jgi:hypothetical protein
VTPSVDGRARRGASDGGVRDGIVDLEPAAPVLFDRLRRTSDEDARSGLVRAIAHAAGGSGRVKSSLLEALREEKMRLSMLEVLERLGPAAADAVPALRRLGRSSDAGIQQAVARALERIEDRGK